MPARTLARWISLAGVELVGGLLVLTVAAWVFGAIAEDVAEGDTNLDTRLAAWLHDHASPGWTTFFEGVTLLGNGPTLGVVTLVSAIILARAGRSGELQLLLLGAVGAQILTLGLKLGFERERPFFADPLATETTYSFPSGHSSGSLAVYGTLGFILARHLADRRARIASLAAAALLVGLIGFSRLYLGVHFLTDVVAGFSVGLAWVALCAVVLHLHVRLRARRQTSL